LFRTRESTRIPRLPFLLTIEAVGRYDMTKDEKTTDALAILHRRYVGDGPDQLGALEDERLHAKVARQIYDLRTSAGLSQKALAEKIGTTQSVISRLEDADYEGHSLSMLRRIAAALDAQVDVELEPTAPAVAQEVREPESATYSAGEERPSHAAPAISRKLGRYATRRKRDPLPRSYYETFARLSEELTRTQQVLQGGDLVRRLEDSWEPLFRHVQQMRAPLEEARKAVETSVLWKGLRQPEILRIQKDLSRALTKLSTVDAMVDFLPSYDTMALMIDDARRSWSKALPDARVSYAFSALSTLSNAIERGPYSALSVAALHSQLGDWTKVKLSDELLDVRSRQHLYPRFGLDPRLIAPDAEIFESMLEVTGFRGSAPPLVPAYAGADLALEVKSEEADLAEQAASDYRMLFQLESQLRAFIDRVLTEAFGSDWLGRRVHREVVKRWQQRREEVRRAKAPGEAHEELLSYADFGDLEGIVCRRDHWPHFKRFFARKALVQESFTRLAPLRKDIAHSRALSKADRLYLYVEIRRLWVAFRSDPQRGNVR
jgi:transcriptional regulator with XRE-family HTH domain